MLRFLIELCDFAGSGSMGSIRDEIDQSPGGARCAQIDEFQIFYQKYFRFAYRIDDLIERIFFRKTAKRPAGRLLVKTFWSFFTALSVCLFQTPREGTKESKCGKLFLFMLDRLGFIF